MQATIELVKSEMETLTRAVSKCADLLALSAVEQNLAKQNFILGIAAYEVRKYSLSIDHLRASFLAEPSAETAIRLAMSNMRASNYFEMEKWAIKAIELQPGGSFKMILYGSEIAFMSIFAASQFYLGRIDQAYEAAMKVQAENPGDQMFADIIRMCNLARGKAEVGDTSLKFASSAISAGSGSEGLFAVASGKESM